MIKQVVIARDVYAPDTWTRTTVDDVFDYLKTQFDVWPDTARLYHNYIAIEHDVTPDSQADLDQLRTLDGVFYVVVYPADPFTLIVIAVAVVVSVAIALLIPVPAIPDAGRTSSSTQGSPNNELSSRGNKPRPLGRIPDIFGTVRSTPDLIALPYSVFENNVEVEYMIAAVGRGQYDIKDVYDGDTRLIDVDGASAQFYELNSSVVTGAPFKVIGAQITQNPYEVSRSNSVNGQVLRPSNTTDFEGKGDIYFESPNLVRLAAGSSRDFTTEFVSGGNILINRTKPLSLSGEYTIVSVSQGVIELSNPSAVNTGWLLPTIPAYLTSALLSRNSARPISFILDDQSREFTMLNFVCANGLYAASGGMQYQIDVDVAVKIEKVDDNDVPTGDFINQVFTLSGSATNKNAVAATRQFFDNFGGRCRVTVYRTTFYDLDYDGTVVEEVRWRDLYAAKSLTRTMYGDMTIVRARTRATTGALSVKERKLNCLVQRKLPTYNPSTGLMTTTRYPTNSAADAFASVCLDAFIGRRDVSEVDLAGIYQAIADVADYFGTDSAAEFCYTFDRENQSFEEIATTIAQAVFCEAYRQGNQIKLSFERETDDSVLLFNHRNKVPKSEKRTITFGLENSFDGVEYEWIDPADDTKTVLKIPNDLITNPKKITSVGVRNARQAHFSAWRVWNKLRYQRESVEFEALRESDLLVRKDRILVADNTRTGTQDGEIEAQTGLIVTTSQPCTFDPAKSYTMHLQLYDGSVDAIGCAAGSDAYSVVLDRAPLLPLVLEHDRYLRTIYMITSNDDVRAKAFLVGEKSNAGRMTNSLKCVNYDARYYQNDSDFIDELIP